MKKDTNRLPPQRGTPDRANWWLRLASVDGKISQETIEQRERARRSRLLAWILLGLFVALLLFIPATFKDRPSLFLVSAAAAGLVVALICNRLGLVTLAGVLLVLLTIAATLGVVVAAPGGSIRLVYLPAYDFLVVSVVLGASILPRISAFLIALLDIALIYADLIWQPRAADLQQALREYGLPVLAGRPSAILVITAVIAYLWVRGMDQAVRRADRAEELQALQQYVNRIEIEHTARVKEFVEQTIEAIGELANGHQGQLRLAPGHPWQPQAIFINTQLKQFYKLKQADLGDYEQAARAATLLAHLLRRVNAGQAPLSSLDPRHFTTRITVIDEITGQIYQLLLTQQKQICAQKIPRRPQPSSPGQVSL